MSGLLDPALGLPLAVLVPTACAVPALLFGRVWPRSGPLAAVLGALLTLALAAGLMLSGAPGAVGRVGGLAGAGPGPVRVGGVELYADGLSLLLLVLTGAVGTMVALYMNGPGRERSGAERSDALFLLMLAGLNGCAVSGDLFNLFVCMLLVWVPACALAAAGDTAGAPGAGMRLLAAGAVSAALFLFGVALTYGALGTLAFREVADGLRRAGGLGASPVMLLAAAFMLAGLGTMAALVPFHGWLPDLRREAPAPVGAMVSGLLVKVLGVSAMARVLLQALEAHRFRPLVWVVIALGMASLVVGAAMAAGEWDIRRLLAFAGIGQTGLVVAGLGLAMLCMAPAGLDGDIQVARLELSDPQAVLREFEDGGLTAERLGPGGAAALRGRVSGLRARLEALQLRKDAMALLLAGAILHLAGLAFAGSLLALCGGSFARAAGTADLRELGGLWGRMPVTGACCLVGALALAAAPPFAGFWSLLMILAGAAMTGHWAIAAVAGLAAMLNAAALARMQKHALFGPMSARVIRFAREPGAGPCLAVAGLAAACLALGLAVAWIVPGVVVPAVEALRQAALGWAGAAGPR